MKCYSVYTMSNASHTLYAGVTSDLAQRVYQHKHQLCTGFTSNYRFTRLVHYEVFDDVTAAIAREKQIKGWRREKKITLIESMNPGWRDLSEDL